MKGDMCTSCFPYALDELSEMNSIRFESHMHVCEKCQEEYAELSELVQWVKEDNINASVKSSVRGKAIDRFNVLSRWAIPGIAALLIVVGLSMENTPIVHAATHKFTMHIHEMSSDLHQTMHKIRAAAKKLA